MLLGTNARHSQGCQHSPHNCTVMLVHLEHICVMLGVNLCCIADWELEGWGAGCSHQSPGTSCCTGMGNEPLCAGCCPEVAAGNSIVYDIQEVTWDALLLLSRWNLMNLMSEIGTVYSTVVWQLWSSESICGSSKLQVPCLLQRCSDGRCRIHAHEESLRMKSLSYWFQWKTYISFPKRWFSLFKATFLPGMLHTIIQSTANKPQMY